MHCIGIGRHDMSCQARNNNKSDGWRPDMDRREVLRSGELAIVAGTSAGATVATNLLISKKRGISPFYLTHDVYM